MFKLEEICEELSQIQIPMRAEELESIGIHVEEEASADEAERFQDGYIRDVHNCWQNDEDMAAVQRWSARSHCGDL